MKRINDKKMIPDFFKNNKYDEFYKNYNVKRLAHEIQERQGIFFNIKDIIGIENGRPISEDGDESIVIMKQFIIKDGERIEITPPPKTLEQTIEDEKKIYLRWIEQVTEPTIIEHPKFGKILNRKSNLNLFHFDTLPYIQPIMEIKDDLELHSRYAFRSNIDKYEEYPTISINLDFSDDVILTDIKNHLKKLRLNLEHSPKFLPPKEFMRKFKNERTLQIIDILMWQELTQQKIEYETLANFLFPNEQYSGNRIRETFIPFAKKLLDSNSKESAYLCYLSDKD